MFSFKAFVKLWRHQGSLVWGPLPLLPNGRQRRWLDRFSDLEALRPHPGKTLSELW